MSKRTLDGQKASLPRFGLANANFVTDRLAVGGDLSPNFVTAQDQLTELVKNGITHLVDLRSEWSDQYLVQQWAPGMQYLHHPVDDAGQRIPAQWFAELVDWVRPVLAGRRNRIYVHCHMGVNRAPSAVFAILLSQGMDLRIALDRIRAARPVAVIDYARDALEWHLAATGADARSRRNARRRLARWRGSNRIDQFAVIRAIRDTQTPPNRWILRLDAEQAREISQLVGATSDTAIEVEVSGQVAALSQFDEVILATDRVLIGRSMVIGPVTNEANSHFLPLFIDTLGIPVPVRYPLRLGSWARGRGPSLRLLTDEEYAGFKLDVAGRQLT